MATEIKFTDRLVHTERMASSRNGNPRYMLHFASGVALPTTPDAGIAYGINNREYWGCDLEITKNGRGHVIYVTPL